jgi:hypothetical protein
MTREILQSAAPLYSARPVIEVDNDRHEIVQEMLAAMKMREQEGGLSSLELRFHNTAHLEGSGLDMAFEYSDVDQLALGRHVRVLAGDDEEPREIFQGVISGLEFIADTGGAPQLVVLAEDSLQIARMSRQTRVFEEATLAGIIEILGGESGLSCRVSGLDDDIGTQVQLNESNLAFMRRLLARYNGDMQIVGDELQAFSRSEARRSDITLEYGSQLIRVRIVADLADQVSEVTYSGWNAAAGEDISVSSETSAVTGPGSGRRGDELLADALVERSEHLGNIGAVNADEAQALVNSAFRRRARRFVRAQGTALGNPLLRVGSHLRLRGVGPRFSNTYYETETCHIFDLTQGYRPDFKACCAFFEG